MATLNIVDAVKTVLGSSFSYVRGFTSTHHGVDISAAKGTAVPSLHEGTVVFSGFAGGGGAGYVHAYSPPTNATQSAKFNTTGGGNVVVVQGSDGILYHYAHLSELDVHVGDAVAAGGTIGKIGDTGDATGPHLHFAEFNPATHSWVDPTAFLEGLGPTTAHPNLPSSGSISLADLLGIAPDTVIDQNNIRTYIDQANALDVSAPIKSNLLQYLGGLGVGFGHGTPAMKAGDIKINTATGTSWSPLDDAGGIGTTIANVGYFIAFIFVGIALLLVAALVSRNSASNST